MHDHKNTEMVFMISLKKKNTTTTINLSSQHQRALVVMTSKAAGKRILEWAASIPTIITNIKMQNFRNKNQVFMCSYPQPLSYRLKSSITTSSVRSCYSSLRASASQLRVRTRMATRCHLKLGGKLRGPIFQRTLPGSKPYLVRRSTLHSILSSSTKHW